MAHPSRFTAACAVAVSLLLSAHAAAEDLTVVFKTTFGNNEGTTTQYLTQERSKTSTRDVDSIIGFADGKLTMIDHRKKEYWQTTIEEMEESWDRLARQMRTRGGADMFDMRGEPKLEKLSGHQKFAGYECEHWSLQIGDALEVDFWAAPSLIPPAKYYDARRLASASMGPMGVLFQRMYEELKKVKGYPLSTAVIIRTPFFRTQSLEEATEVRKGPIPPSTFDVPAGYTRGKSPFDR
ncbi:MAG: DUF4412 domain-containing protein [Acidobacteriota bacterium]|nr:DUF4412 domain-containing protein [Acidobacteriota bacterium]